MSQKLDLQFLFGRFRAKLVQNLILYGRLRGIFDVKGFTFIFVIERQDFHTLRIVAFQKSLVRATLAASGVRAKLI